MCCIEKVVQVKLVQQECMAIYGNPMAIYGRIKI